MRRVLIGAFLGLFFWGFQVLRLKLGSRSTQRITWSGERKTTNSLNISSRRIKTENNVKKIGRCRKSKNMAKVKK